VSNAPTDAILVNTGDPTRRKTVAVDALLDRTLFVPADR
jgi:hypothetical protein